MALDLVLTADHQNLLQQQRLSHRLGRNSHCRCPMAQFFTQRESVVFTVEASPSSWEARVPLVAQELT